MEIHEKLKENHAEFKVQSINWSIDQLINRSIVQSINRSIDQSINCSIDQLLLNPFVVVPLYRCVEEIGFEIDVRDRCVEKIGFEINVRGHCMSNWLGGGVQQPPPPQQHVLCRRRGSKKGASQLSVCTLRDAEKKTHKNKCCGNKYSQGGCRPSDPPL